MRRSSSTSYADGRLVARFYGGPADVVGDELLELAFSHRFEVAIHCALCLLREIPGSSPLDIGTLELGGIGGHATPLLGASRVDREPDGSVVQTCLSVADLSVCTRTGQQVTKLSLRVVSQP